MTPLAARARRGFTLVEVAVTIVIVGIGLTLVLQAMNTATTSAAQTRNMKIARELGQLTLGRIKSGLYQEEVRDRFYGSYAEDEFPEFEFEVLLGDEAFDEQPDVNDPDRPFDNFRAREERLAEEADATEEDEEATQPYEKVKVKVVFPQLHEYRNYLILESWVPWEQVYGPDEDAEAAAAAEGESPS